MSDKSLSSLPEGTSIASSEYIYGVISGNSRKVPVSALVPAIGLPTDTDDNAVIRYDASTGLLQGSGVKIDDNDNLRLPANAAISFSGGDVTATHSPNALTFAGASSGYHFTATGAGLVIGELADATAFGAIGFTGIALSTANYAFAFNGVSTLINALSGGAINLRIANSSKAILDASSLAPATAGGLTDGTSALPWANTYSRIFTHNGKATDAVQMPISYDRLDYDDWNDLIGNNGAGQQVLYPYKTVAGADSQQFLYQLLLTRDWSATGNAVGATGSGVYLNATTPLGDNNVMNWHVSAWKIISHNQLRLDGISIIGTYSATGGGTFDPTTINVSTTGGYANGETAAVQVLDGLDLKTEYTVGGARPVATANGSGEMTGTCVTGSVITGIPASRALYIRIAPPVKASGAGAVLDGGPFLFLDRSCLSHWPAVGTIVGGIQWDTTTGSGTTIGASATLGQLYMRILDPTPGSVEGVWEFLCTQASGTANVWKIGRGIYPTGANDPGVGGLAVRSTGKLLWGTTTQAALSGNTLAFTAASTGYSFTASTSGVHLGELSDSTNFAALAYAGSGVSTTTYALAFNATTTLLNVPSGGTLQLRIANAAKASLSTTAWSPSSNDGLALGTTLLRWSDHFGATGYVLDLGGDWIATHSAGILTVGTGDFRVTTAGTNAASVVTVGGTQTLTNKSLTSPTLTTPAFSGVPTGTVTSGTYTPTLTGVANVAASTAYACQYLRVGNVVTVSGRFDLDTTTASVFTQLGISLPIASDITAANQCGGVAGNGAIDGLSGDIRGDATNNRAEFAVTTTNTDNQAYFFTFTYLIS